jgi:CHAT domain-containing protein/Flp pilus assembly protein TadD
MKQYKTVFVFIAFFCIYQSTNAQTDFPALSQQFIDYRKANKQDSALYIARKMNQLALKEQSDTSFWYALSMRAQGFPYYNRGDYDSTLYYWKKAVDLFKEYHPNHSEFASSLNHLGVLYKSMGDYKAAAPYYEQALAIFKQSLGENHPDYAMSLYNLGTLVYAKGDYKAAAPYFEQALTIYKQSLGENHPNYARCLNSLGVLYKSMGDYKAAAPYYEQALAIKKQSLGENHPAYARSLNNLGILYYEMGDYKAAALYYEQALDIFKQSLGENHQDYFSTENSFAYLLMRTNREKQAHEILSENFKKQSKEIADNFEWLNDNQKEAYWKKESSFYDKLTWFANEAHEKVPEAVGLNYNSVLVTKSKMLEAKISSENYYRDVDVLREELAYRRRLLAKLESDGSTEKNKLETLRKEADSLDKRLTLSWPEYAQQKKNLSITWDQVQQNLDKAEAAIEFLRFKNEDDSVVYYNALVLKKGDKNPTLVKLCKEKDLQSISPKMGYSAYYPLVWQPLEAALKDVKTVYYAPTGELYNVPFHAIYAPKGKGDEVLAAKTDKRGVIIQNERAATEQNAEYLMDRYTMHQLTSTRYLAMGLKQKAKETIGNTMAMVGGVNYDYLPGTTVVLKKKKKDINASRSSASASGRLNYLEGTKTEIERINQEVTAATWQTKLIENNEAVEENITKLEGKEAKGILHLATHGYAFPEYNFKDTSINKNSLRYNYRYSTNPMVRSGLILAGGNWAWTGSDTLSKLGAKQNGILTALEVSQLNLNNTKLVVLSACETGLGKIEGSEGTFGLKRGFKLAGVEQMIVSLWSVPDKETMELMTIFYSVLARTLNPVISFEKAQKEMRNKYPTDPEKWAGFVLVR